MYPRIQLGRYTSLFFADWWPRAPSWRSFLLCLLCFSRNSSIVLLRTIGAHCRVNASRKRPRLWTSQLAFSSHFYASPHKNKSDRHTNTDQLPHHLRLWPFINRNRPTPNLKENLYGDGLARSNHGDHSIQDSEEIHGSSSSPIFHRVQHQTKGPFAR